MSSRFLSNILVNDSYTFPGEDGVEGQSIVTDGNGNLTFSEVNRSLFFYGKASAAITKGQAVMFAGVQGDHFLIAPAVQATIEANHEYILGIAKQDFAINEFGYVTEFGRVSGLNTSAYSDGDIIWYDSASATAGAITTTEPTPPNAKIQLAAVIRSHPAEGVLFVRPTIYHGIEELENVNMTELADGNLLSYNNATSTWENTDDLKVNSVESVVFYNDKTINTDYSIPENKNAVIIGPVIINSNITIFENSELKIL